MVWFAEVHQTGRSIKDPTIHVHTTWIAAVVSTIQIGQQKRKPQTRLGYLEGTEETSGSATIYSAGQGVINPH